MDGAFKLIADETNVGDFVVLVMVEQLQVFVFVLAKGIVFVFMRGNVFVLLRGIVNGDPVRGQCQMFPANIRRYFAFFISYVNIAVSRLLGQLSDWIRILSSLMFMLVLSLLLHPFRQVIRLQMAWQIYYVYLV